MNFKTDMVSQGQTFVILLACSIVLIVCTGANAKKSQEPLIVHCKGTYNETENYFYRRTSPFSSSNTTCMHYAWSTTGSFINHLQNLSEPVSTTITGYPTLLVAHSNSTDVCNINKCDLSGIPTINSSITPFFTVVVFRRIIEFNITPYPKNKTATNATKYNCTGDNCATKKFEDMLYKDSCFQAKETDYGSFFLNSSNVEWTTHNSANKMDRGDLVFSGRDISHGNGSFTMNIVTHFPSKAGYDRLNYFPKTLLFENSTTFDLVLDHFNYTQSNWQNPSSRLALELIIVHGSSVVNKAQQKFTLDDEFTPSVFSTVTYPINDTSGGEGGYFQWKPISYQSDGRKSTSSQQANRVYAENNTDCIVHDGPIVRTWFMVIGTEGDDTFINSNYSTWTAVIGYGKVPQDTISFTVIITIIVGLGVPAVLVLLGGVYVVIKKKPWQNVKRWVGGNKQGYSALN